MPMPSGIAVSVSVWLPVWISRLTAVGIVVVKVIAAVIGVIPIAIPIPIVVTTFPVELVSVLAIASSSSHRPTPTPTPTRRPLQDQHPVSSSGLGVDASVVPPTVPAQNRGLLYRK